jgi:vacuolar-type H+-ATPase subunit E/Vma4
MGGPVEELKVSPYCSQAITSEELLRRIEEAEAVRSKELQEQFASAFEDEKRGLLSEISRLGHPLESSEEQIQEKKGKLKKQFEAQMEQERERVLAEAKAQARTEFLGQYEK